MAEEGEEEARRQWTEDWWGWGPVLRAMRMRRGWRAEQDMDDVVFWEGGESRRDRYSGILPWD